MSHHESFHLVGISEWWLVFKILNIEAFQVLDFEDHVHIWVQKAWYLPKCRTSPYGVVEEYLHIQLHKAWYLPHISIHILTQPGHPIPNSILLSVGCLPLLSMQLFLWQWFRIQSKLLHVVPYDFGYQIKGL